MAGGLRLYVSRSQAKIRRVVNEEALLPILRNYRFEIIRPEELSFHEQVVLFAGASVIVGPHGGGLTNMLWAQESCVVFEVLDPEITARHFYWSLAHSLGHRYFMSVAEACPNPGAEPDLRIDPVKFEAAFRHILDP
jgi:capsular polysaccharide biosynthesis protein